MCEKWLCSELNEENPVSVHVLNLVHMKFSSYE